MAESEKHVMIDIETLDNVSSAIILAIGAVEFDINTGKIGKSFEQMVKIDSNHNNVKTRTLSGETLLWWLKQDQESIEKTFFNPERMSLQGALSEFEDFLLKIDPLKKFQIWCKGAKFDFAILSDAFRQFSMPVPWNYRNENCCRTMFNRFPVKKGKFKGIAHSPIDDCKNQIKQLVQIQTISWEK